MPTVPLYLEHLQDPNKDPNSRITEKNFQRITSITTAAIATGAVIKLPLTSADNVIQPAGAGVVPLTVKGFAGQTAKLFVAADSTGAEKFSVSAAGAVVAASTMTATSYAGAWAGTAIGATFGGTGQTAYTVGDTLYASSTTALSKLGIGSAGHFLKVASGLPAWSALTSGEVTTAIGYTPVNKAGDTMSGLLVLSGDAVAALNPVSKQQFDAAIASVSSGIQVKTQVACATTANITLSGEQTIDGVLTSGSRVLVKDQSTGSQNGIYVSAAGAWARATDMDAGTEFPGALVFVAGGTANIGDQWYCSNTGTVTVGTTAITFILYYNSTAYVAGAGLTLSGVTFAVGTASSSRIVVNADDIDLATTAITPGTYAKATYDAYGRATAGTTLVNADIPTTLTGHTYNSLTLTAAAVGFTIAGGTTSKTLTVALDASVSGTNTGDQTITLTGNVTGSGTGSFATTIGTNVVTLAMQAQIATASFMGRNTAATGNQEVLSIATAKTMLGLTGTNSGDQTITLSGDVTGSGTGVITATIGTAVVTLGKLANLPTLTIIGNNTGGSAAPLALTVAQTRTMLGLGTADSPTFTSATISGLTAGRVVYAGTGGVLSAGNMYWDNTNGYLGIGSAPGGELAIQVSKSGGDVSATIFNQSNTANSTAHLNIFTAGASAGDPYIYMNANNGVDWKFGVDVSASSNFVFSRSGSLGTSNQLVIGNGAVAVTGTLTASNLSGTNTGDQTSVTGNAGTATALQTARTINGTSFNGTANITVTAAAGTLTGATLAAGVTASSLTSVGTLASLTVSGNIALGGRLNIGGASDTTGFAVNAASGNIATASAGAFDSFGSGTPGATNYEALEMRANAGSGATISVVKGGTGTYRDLNLVVGGNTALTAQATTGSIYIAGRLNINGATDTSTAGVNVASKHIVSSGGSAGVHAAFGSGDISSSNSEYIFMSHESGSGVLSVTKSGTGTYRSLLIQTGGGTALTIDSSQNVIPVRFAAPSGGAGAAPGSPQAGQVFFSTVNNYLYAYIGGAWRYWQLAGSAPPP